MSRVGIGACRGRAALRALLTACFLVSAAPGGAQALSVLDFDTSPSGPHPNGTPLGQGHDLGFATLTFDEDWETRGPVVFDSDPNGPVQNRQYPASNLLVDLGNILTHQDERYFERLEDGRFLYPTQSPYGGTFTFHFHEPMTALSIDLIDLDHAAEHPEPWEVRLVDQQNAVRTYSVPGGFTDSPGYATLDLTRQTAQEGENSLRTSVVQDASFDPAHVTIVEVVMRSSGAIDNLRFDTVTAQAPEPGALVSLAAALGALALLRKR